MKNIAIGSGVLVLVLSSLAFAKDDVKTTAQAEPAQMKKAAQPAPAAPAPAAAAEKKATPAAPAPAAAPDKKAAPAAQPAPAADKVAPAMKPVAPTPPIVPQPAPAPMEAPKPAPEVALVFKAIGGNWRCTGTSFDMATNANKSSNATMSVKMEPSLDKFWIMSSFAEKKGKENPNPYKFSAFRTFNPKTKKWTSVMIDNMGMEFKSTSAGPVNGVVAWESQGEWEGKKYWARDTETSKGPREVTMKGEISMDGKTWQTMYDMACKK
jgi:hypothetical protein